MWWGEVVRSECLLSSLNIIWGDSCFWLGSKLLHDVVDATKVLNNHFGANDNIRLSNFVVVIENTHVS
jgi:hypothetical protein